MKLNKRYLLFFIFILHFKVVKCQDWKSMYWQERNKREVREKQHINENTRFSDDIKRISQENERLRVNNSVNNSPYWKNKAKQEESAKKNEQRKRKNAQNELAEKNNEIAELDKQIQEKLAIIEAANGNNGKILAELAKLKDENEKFQAIMNGRCACCAESSPDTVEIAKAALDNVWAEYIKFDKEEKYINKTEDEVKADEKRIVNNLWKVVSHYKVHMDCEQNIAYIEFLKKNRLDIRSRLYKEDKKTAYNVFYPVEVFSAIRRGFDISDYDCRKDMVKRVFPNIKEYLEGIDETPPQITGQLVSAITDYKKKEYAKSLGKIIKFYEAYGKSLPAETRGQIEYCYGTILLWNLGNVTALQDLGVLNTQLASDLKNPQERGQKLLQNILGKKDYDLKIKKQAYKALETYY